MKPMTAEEIAGNVLRAVDVAEKLLKAARKIGEDALYAAMRPGADHYSEPPAEIRRASKPKEQ